MRLPTWDKVTLTWKYPGTGGIGTSVRIDGRFDPKAYNPTVFSSKADKLIHGLVSMEACSLPHEQNGCRQGELVLDIRHKSGVGLAPNKAAIEKLLDAQMDRVTTERPRLQYRPHVEPPQGESWTETKFKIKYTLGNGEEFCDTTIELARAAFTALGVHDDSGHWLAHFTLKRETFVRFDGGWITFPHWLRIEHCLPVAGPEDGVI